MAFISTFVSRERCTIALVGSIHPCMTVSSTTAPGLIHLSRVHWVWWRSLLPEPQKICRPPSGLWVGDKLLTICLIRSKRKYGLIMHIITTFESLFFILSLEKFYNFFFMNVGSLSHSLWFFSSDTFVGYIISVAVNSSDLGPCCVCVHFRLLNTHLALYVEQRGKLMPLCCFGIH